MSTNTTRFIVVRHGETIYNVERRFTGMSDIALTTMGKYQAARVGAYLADEDIDVVVASDLQRARDTAQAIARYHDLPVLSDPDLREISMGEWEGKRIVDILAIDPENAARIRSDPTHYAPPGGETLEQLRVRVARALERWTAGYPGKTVVWVSHGGTINILMCHLLGIDLNRRHQFHQHNASITEVIIGGAYPSFIHVNEVAHLKDIEVEEMYNEEAMNDIDEQREEQPHV